MKSLRDRDAVPLLIVLSVTAYVLTSRPEIGQDAMRGLLAVEQQLAGRGNTLTEIVTADLANLQADRHESIGWWAPGQQQFVYALRRAGLSLDESLRASTGVSWIVGIAAWALLFRRTVSDRRLAAWVIAAFALLRASHASAFRYTGGETLLWAAFPIVALVNLSAFVARGRTSWLMASVAGLLAGTLVMLKYSGGILGLALGAGWVWAWFRRDLTATRVAAWTAGAAAALAVVAFAGVLTLMQGSTPASDSWSYAPSMIVAAGIGGALGAISDAPHLLGFAMRRMGLAWSDTLLAVFLMGCSALCAMWAVACWQESSNAREPPPLAERMAWLQAVTVTLATSIAVMAIQFRGGLISWESRHYQYGAFLLLPFFAKALQASFRVGGLRLRVLACANLVVFFAMPVLYGSALIVARTVRSAVSNPSDGTGWLPDGRPETTVIDEIESLGSLRTAVLATPSIPAAISFADRRVQFVMQSGEWRSERFQGHPAGGVALLLRPGISRADGRVLRDGFTDVHTWTEVPLSSAPAAQLWFGR